MCGPKYCSMKITEEIRAMAADRQATLPLESEQRDKYLAQAEVQ
jgi:hypothetical protein